MPAVVATQIVHEAIRREKGRGLPLIVVRGDGELHAAWVHDPAELPCLAYATVVLAPCAGGLAESGLPDAGASAAGADVGDTPDKLCYLAGGCGDEASDGVELPAWAEDAVELRVPIPDDGDGTKARCWVYARRRAGTETLDEHGRRVGEATAMPDCLVAGACGPRLSPGRESDTSGST